MGQSSLSAWCASEGGMLTCCCIGLRLAKRSHGGQRVHIIPPFHNLAVPDGNDRDEPVVVGCAGSDNLTVHLVFEDHYTSILGLMHDERVRAVQQDVVAVTRIKCHQCFATINLLWPSRENISKLEDRVVGNGIEIMIAIDMTGQTPLDYVEERVERGEGLVLWIGHDWLPGCGLVRFRPLELPGNPTGTLARKSRALSTGMAD